MSIYIYLPLLSAVLYGLAYALIDRALVGLNAISFLTLNLVTTLIIVLSVHLMGLERIDLKITQDTSSFKYGLLASICGAIALIAAIYVMKNVNATYAAIGEVSYPLFVPIFAYLLFGTKDWSMSTLIGGALILLGVYILIIGKMKAS
jgi:drug/metabolite transporter (DMT)-like permease